MTAANLDAVGVARLKKASPPRRLIDLATIKKTHREGAFFYGSEGRARTADTGIMIPVL